jgi:hypothetical protein
VSPNGTTAAPVLMNHLARTLGWSTTSTTLIMLGMDLKLESMLLCRGMLKPVSQSLVCSATLLMCHTVTKRGSRLQGFGNRAQRIAVGGLLISGVSKNAYQINPARPASKCTKRFLVISRNACVRLKGYLTRSDNARTYQKGILVARI